MLWHVLQAPMHAARRFSSAVPIVFRCSQVALKMKVKVISFSAHSDFNQARTLTANAITCRYWWQAPKLARPIASRGTWLLRDG